MSSLRYWLGNIPVDTDIMYAFVPGYKTPLLLFRYSLRSFAQLSNAIDKIRRAGIEIKSVYLWPAPFKRGTAVFGDTKGKHLAAFRLVYVRSMP